MTRKTLVLDKLTGIVGLGNVTTEPDRLRTYQAAGMVTGGDPLAILKPQDTQQVRELVNLARGEGYNLVFSSSAPPRFRGDSIPRGEGIIVDMSEMSRIVRMDRRNKVAIIEPGVTFEALIAAADQVGLKVLMPLLPRRGKSVLASYLEREPIQIPKYHWDMTDPLFSTELVFGTGDLFRTGAASGPGSLDQQWAVGGAQKSSFGPGQTDFVRVVQGSQGTLAGVTWGSVKLEVKPRIHQIWFAPDDKLKRLVDYSYKALRPKLGDEWFILNSYSLATAIADDPDGIDSLAGRQAPWTLIYGISGYDYLPEERMVYQRQDLTDMAQACGLAPVLEVPGCSTKMMESILAAPSPEPYYKMRPRGGFQDIFFLTTLDQAEHLIATMQQVCKKQRYSGKLGIYIQPIQHGRTVHLEFTIYYDPEDVQERDKAIALFEEASRKLESDGAFFSRPYGPWADLAYARCPDTVRALRKVKNILDPDRVLNRGKLCFKEEVV